MLISPAAAAHFTPPSESSGGAIALSIILAAIIVLGLVYLAQKKWRNRKSKQDASGE